MVQILEITVRYEFGWDSVFHSNLDGILYISLNKDYGIKIMHKTQLLNYEKIYLYAITYLQTTRSEERRGEKERRERRT